MVSKSNLIQMPIPFAECNNPLEYDNLRDWQKEGLAEWIEDYVKPHATKNYNPNRSSYGLKHMFQYSYGFYVTNGQFKGAMLAAGFQPECYDSLNWTFKVGKRVGTRINKKK
jgi:hypothetical protein